MSLFDSASLVVTPNGVKEGKLYSIKPSDGSGDLSVTRATTATRVNSAGLVEVVPYNLLGYSDTLNDFTVINATKTNNATTSPFGLNNANSLMETAVNVFDHYVTNGGFGSLNNSLTYSVYLKQNGRRYVQLATVTSQGVARPIFDLQDGVYINNVGSNTGITTAIENVGNGWFRCSVIHPSNTTNLDQVTVILQKTATYESYLGDVTKGCFVFGAQLVQGSSAKDYYPTTTRLNIPRLDYTNGSCPSILVEPQRTNLVTYSDNVALSLPIQSNTTITSNTSISPDGTQNADNVLFGTSSYRLRVTSISALTNYTASLFFKNVDFASSEEFTLNLSDGVFGAITATIKPSNGTATFTRNTSGWSSVSGKIENYGNGWYRVSVSGTSIGGGSGWYEIGCNVSKNVLIFGMQLELGNYPTSYIPTTSASVTRNADVFSVSLPNTDMTFCAYLELAEPTLGSNTGDWLQIYNNVSILGRGYGYAQAVGFADAYVLGATASSSRKIIWKQESGTTAKIFLDGVLVATSTTGTYSNPFNRLGIFGEHLSKPAKINMFTFFNENLTDAQCIELTTL